MERGEEIDGDDGDVVVGDDVHGSKEGIVCQWRTTLGKVYVTS